MNESLLAILNTLPPKRSRSKLEPYKEFIHELRRRGRSYREIAEILRDRCGVAAAVHSVYNFVRVREKAKRKMRTRQNSTPRSAEMVTSSETCLQPRTLADDDAWKNIEALKQRKGEAPAAEKVFVYDEDEPLRLVRGTGRSSAGKNKTKTER